MEQVDCYGAAPSHARAPIDKLAMACMMQAFPDGGKKADVLHLDIDPKSHPAWTGGQQHLVDRGGRLSRFQKKFSGFLKTEEKK